ncbi:hypothetical protein D3C76_274450 [compost metagenome]|uniref:DUF2158 domain-containing protein n=1 Tax=Pseudomonas kurunegalensis TaxID=485880 RepID=A0ACC5UKJ6_9PSED|nr:DUF2158 domain-containing protein [Pseudomonas kurunegalensis]MBV4514955.1 DUF2158 domain-containing protein [Pseudomonas kurunegalensis]
MSNFQKGDVVQLKSGGPKMTISDLGDFGPLGPENGAKCVWFEKEKRHEHVFDEVVLKKPSTPIGVMVPSR